MIKVTTKRQDAEAFLGRKLLADLEAGRCGGDTNETLIYIQRLFNEVGCMPSDDIGVEAREAAGRVSLDLNDAILKCKAADLRRQMQEG